MFFHVFFQNGRKGKRVIGVEQSLPIKLCVIGVFQFLLPKTPNTHYFFDLSETPIAHF